MGKPWIMRWIEKKKQNEKVIYENHVSGAFNFLLSAFCMQEIKYNLRFDDILFLKGNFAVPLLWLMLCNTEHVIRGQ